MDTQNTPSGDRLEIAHIVIMLNRHRPILRQMEAALSGHIILNAESYGAYLKANRLAGAK